MEDNKNGERLARLEADVLSIKDYMIRLEGKLDAWTSMYVPRQEAYEMFRSRDSQIKDIKDEITELKENSKSNKAMMVGWFSFAAAAISSLVAIIALYKS